MKITNWICICICLLSINFASAEIGNNKYKFFAKFAFGEDNFGKFEIKGRLVSQATNPGDTFKLETLFYEDLRWDSVINTDDCVQKKLFKNLVSELSIPGDGSWSLSQVHEFKTLARTRLWYVAAADCEGTTHISNPSLPKIELEIAMYNGSSHFSQEDYGTLTFYFIMLVLFFGLFGNSVLRFYREFKKYETFENPMVVLMLGVSSDLTCVFFTFMHLLVLYYNGEGLFILTVFARLSYMFSQILIVWMLMMIGYGWTITYKTVDEKDIYIILMLFVIMVHMMITALTFVDDDEYHKYHDFSGIQGIIVIILRFILFFAYLYGIYSTYSSAVEKQKKNIISFGVVSIFYILAFPTVWIVSSFCDPYVRKRVITFSSFSVQALSIYWMVHQFTDKGTSYFNASEKSKSILPGSKRD